MESKMLKIAELAKTKLAAVHFSVQTNDFLMSNVLIVGSFDPKDEWQNGILQNSRYFKFHITPKSGRYYHEGDVVSAELICCGIDMPKFRKVSGTPEKVVDKIAEWMYKVVAS